MPNTAVLRRSTEPKGPSMQVPDDALVKLKTIWYLLHHAQYGVPENQKNLG